MRILRTVTPVWIVIVAYVIGQIGVILFFANGPHIDEAFYGVGGMRMLEGYGLSDGYLSWFNGSPFGWPVLAGLGFRLGGLEGERFMALAFSTVTLWAVSQTATRLFDERVGFFTALALALSGQFFALGHLGVYDTAALTFLTLAVGCLPLLKQSGQVRWAIVGGGLSGLAIVTKYGYVLPVAILVALLIAYLNREQWIKLGVVWIGLTVLVAGCYFLIFFGGLWPGSIESYYGANNELYTFNRMVVRLVYFIGVPALLALLGLWVARRRLSFLVYLILFGALFAVPAYHLRTLYNVSLHKHVVMGFGFAYILVGAGLAWLWEWRARRGRWAAIAVLAGLAGLGGGQWYLQEFYWIDFRPAINYVLAHFKPGDTVATDAPWQFLMYFYRTGQVTSLDEIKFAWDIEQRRNDLCEMKWVVARNDPDDPGHNDEILTQLVQQCQFEVALEYTIRRPIIRAAGYFDTLPATVTVYHRP